MTLSGYDVRRLQATAEISIESKSKPENPTQVMEFMEIGKIIAEKCGISTLTASSSATTRFKQATLRLFNSRELMAESPFHRNISQTQTELPCFKNVTYPENAFGNTRIPYNVNDLVTNHESLMREYNSLRVAYKSWIYVKSNREELTARASKCRCKNDSSNIWLKSERQTSAVIYFQSNPKEYAMATEWTKS